MISRLSVREVDRLLREHLHTTPSVRCPLGKAAGRVLRQEILADRDLPPFDRCMLDGFAVRAAEAKPGTVFTRTGRVHAGEPSMPLDSSPGSAIEIMTGSSLPTGADAVIPYEWTHSIDDDHVRFEGSETLTAQHGVHPKASDFPKGTVLLSPGAILGPVEIGIAASSGVAEPLCSQLPRITIFGTGDELVPVDHTPGPFQIRQSNLYAVENALASAGFPAGCATTLTDDITTERKTLAAAIETNDVIILSGAVSRGRLDWIPQALEELAELIFHGVVQRPGKPLGFWKTERGTAIFGLPGNPVSTLVAAHRYVLPYLRACAGMGEQFRPKLSLASPFLPHPEMTLFIPFTYDKDGRALPCPTRNSGDYARLSKTEGFLEVPAGTEELPPNTSLSFYLWQK